MNSRLRHLILGLVLALGLSRATHAGEFHLGIGVAYSSGLHDSFTDLEDLYDEAGFEIEDSFEVPIGLVLHSYYEWKNGLGIGASLGPTALFLVEEEDFGSSEDAEISGVIPLGIDLRYTFLGKGNVSPYVRAGLRYPLVFGDNLDSSDPGAFGAVGIEFFRHRAVGFGLEVGYDSSKVTVEGPTGAKRESTFAGFTVAAYVLF